jgi:hypothetical protein
MTWSCHPGSQLIPFSSRAVQSGIPSLSDEGQCPWLGHKTLHQLLLLPPLTLSPHFCFSSTDLKLFFIYKTCLKLLLLLCFCLDCPSPSGLHVWLLLHAFPQMSLPQRNLPYYHIDLFICDAVDALPLSYIGSPYYRI